MALSFVIFLISISRLLNSIELGPLLLEGEMYVDVGDSYEGGYSVGDIDSEAREEIQSQGYVAGLTEYTQDERLPSPTGLASPTPSLSPTSIPKTPESAPTQQESPGKTDDLEPTTTPTQPAPTTIPTEPIIEEAQPAVTEHTQTLTQAINEWRVSRGLPPLSEHPTICEAAGIRSSAAASDFSHNGFEEMARNGVLGNLGFMSAAENLWQGTNPSSDRAVVSWSESSGHKANMEGDFSHGCGAWQGETAVYLFVKL